MRIKIVLICLCTFFSIFGQQIDIEKAARNGSIEAQKYLSKSYANGTGGFPKNLANAIYFKEMAANQGDPESQYDLFFDYLEGLGTPKDIEKAQYWLEQACKQLYSPAINTYALVIYNSGDYENAFKYLESALELDPTLKYYNTITVKHYLGVSYLNGTGTKQDFQQAYNIFEDCYQKSNSLSGIELSKMYAYGRGVEKNMSKAFQIINDLIEHESNNPLLYDLKGELYLLNNQYEKAKEMWVKELSLNPNAKEQGSFLSVALGESIDYYVPMSNNLQNNTLAIIIANENYKRVPNVPHAINDGAVFKKYLTSTFGVPEENIEYLENASLNDIKYAINNVSQRCEAFKDQMSVIVYYAGHGVPDDKTNEAYLLPVDGFGTDPKSGLNMEDFYESLSGMPAKSVIVLLDACFSGAKRDGGMLMATRGITIKPNMKVPDGKLIVLSATAEDQTAFPIEDQKHGLFTYTLLRKIQETNGDITWGELADYVTETVKTRSIDLAGKLQSPTVSVSPYIKDSWRNLKIR